MLRLSVPSRQQVLSAMKWTSLAALGVQAAAVATVTAVDSMRKRRRPQSGIFPHLPPQDVSVGGNEFTIFTYGRELYDVMLADIRAAKETIYFECFIVKADETGYEFRNALIDAARRGVDVYILLDTWGNLNSDPRFRHFPKMPHLYSINFPLVRTGIFTGRERDKGRDHRKIMTVDGSIGYVGGYNVGRLYAHHWRDTHLRVEGAAAHQLELSFITMWNSYRTQNSPRLEFAPTHDWDSAILVRENAPSRDIYPIRALYIEVLNRASKRAWITMGYFIPDDAMMHALVAAARRGVDVRILIPEYSNHIYADWVARSHYDELLRNGVKIFLYEEAMVHAKTMTVDGAWSTVGTANIDRLSLRGNFEINMEIYAESFATVMEEIFEVDLDNSHELTRQMWAQRSKIAWVLERVLRPLAPLM
ncbi:phospholipase D-like domain-containing protein [Actinomycetaceae bacterium L2_0104]